MKFLNALLARGESCVVLLLRAFSVQHKIVSFYANLCVKSLQKCFGVTFASSD